MAARANEGKADKIPQTLFTPLEIKSLQLKNRLVMTATGGGALLPRDGIISERFKDSVAACARGGVALIITSSCGVARMDFDPPWSKETKIDVDASMAKLRELVEIVHANGAKLGIQMLNLGRQVTSATLGYQPVAPSPIPWNSRSEVPKELSREEIECLIERYGEGARRIKEAGLDMVEIHAAHGYLVHEFLSPNSNRRIDEYGGDIRARARFAIKIIKRIREKVGGQFPIGIRVNGADHIKGGLTLEDAKIFCLMIQEAGADLISVSAGVNGSYPVIVAPFSEPYGCYTHLAAGVKSVVRVPVITVCRIWDPWLAQEILLT
ncbi:NADH:flavin oxidoreductase, partial [Chloroflexota bacterium]